MIVLMTMNDLLMGHMGQILGKHEQVIDYTNEGKMAKTRWDRWDR